MGKYFGTDGFRGEANKDLTVEHAYKVGRYIGWYFGRNKDHAQVVIGKDTRRSSYMLEYALVAGLTASGADVSLMHVTTTPSVAYITRTDGFLSLIHIQMCIRDSHKIFGYNTVPDDYFEAYQNWWERRHHFHMEKDWMMSVSYTHLSIQS